jgi:hypothetical protein
MREEGAPCCVSAFRFINSASSPISTRRQRLHIPDHLRILLNTAITTKEPHPRHTLNRPPRPPLLVPIRLVHQILRLHVAGEVVAHEVVVAVVGDAAAQRAEAAAVAEGVGADGGEDRGEGGVERECAVGVSVAQVFDVFGEVAEEEDVGFADFARYFDLWGGEAGLVKRWGLGSVDSRERG